jgi:hypothetical protein
MPNAIENTVASFLTTAIDAMLSYVPDSKVDEAADSVLDRLQALVDSTVTPIDDALFEPILKKVRSSFNLAGLMRPLVVDTAVELAKTAANTPEYKPSTEAESVASEEVKIEVIEQVMHSELWDALHKK